MTRYSICWRRITMVKNSSILSRIRSYLFVNTGTRQTIIKNTFWLLLAEFINKGSIFLVTLYIAAVLWPKEFWVMSFIISTVWLIVMLGDFWLTTLFVRETSRDKSRGWEFFITITWLKCLLSWLLFFAIFLAQEFSRTLSEFWPLLMLYAAYALITNLSEFLRAYFRPNEAMQHEAALKAIQWVITILIVTITLFYTQEITNIFLSFVLCSVLGLISTIFYIERYTKNTLVARNFSLNLVYYILNKGFYIWLWWFFIALYISSDQVIMWWLGYFEDLGQYSLAYKFTLMASLASAMFFSAVLPKTSTLEYEKNITANYRKWRSAIMKYNFLLVFCIEIVLYLLSFLEFWNYDEVIHILQILFLYNFIEPLGYWWYVHLLALKKENINLIIVIFVWLFNVVTNFLLIPNYSYYGAIFTTIVSYFLYFSIVNYYILWKSQQKK